MKVIQLLSEWGARSFLLIFSLCGVRTYEVGHGGGLHNGSQGFSPASKGLRRAMDVHDFVVVRLMLYMFSPRRWALLDSAAALAPRGLQVADVHNVFDHYRIMVETQYLASLP